MGVTSDGSADSVITMTTTRRDESKRVLGVDACRVGWVGVALGHGVTTPTLPLILRTSPTGPASTDRWTLLRLTCRSVCRTGVGAKRTFWRGRRWVRGAPRCS